MKIELSVDQFLELGQLAGGAFAPLTGFMHEADFNRVVKEMRLESGALFPLPVVLDLDKDVAHSAADHAEVELWFEDQLMGWLEPGTPYSADKRSVAESVFGTSDIAHPGVRFLFDGGDWLLGGNVRLSRPGEGRAFSASLPPVQTRARFREKGWETVVGFQTRNVPHRAHEQLQRVALEHVDGLFIQPLVGRKKAGDYTREAILAGYRVMVDQFYPEERVELGVLTTAMRYAGPREAVFHALIRRNYGCTHFIVGRDHAGVGGFYGKYEAQELVMKHAEELGIRIMPLNGPFHCKKCQGIVSEWTCRHLIEAPEFVEQISGTDVRGYLTRAETPPSWIMRPEVFDAVKGLDMFIGESE